MKKPKVKLDSRKLKAFFVDHTEKIVFGVFVLLLLYFGYSAATHEVFDKAPKDLTDIVTRAKANHGQTQWKPEEHQLKTVSYMKKAENVLAKSEIGTRQFIRPLMEPVVPLDVRREVPKILTVTDLEVASDYGAFHVKQNQERSTRGYHWVVVTGLIPYFDQRSEYAKAIGLSTVNDRFDDQPTYFGAKVQRAEVVTGADDEQLNWQDCPARNELSKAWAFELAKNVWDGEGKDPVEPKYYLDAPPGGYGVADPLAPLVGKQWGSSITHTKLPLPGAKLPESAAEAAAAEAAAAAAPPVEGDPAASAEPDPFGENKPATPPADAPAAGPAASAVAAPANDEVKITENERLFRFFDFTARPGKRYRYRVQLYVYNPSWLNAENAKLEAKHLRPAANDLAAKQYLTSEFSKPSPVVNVIRANNLLVGEIKPPRSSNEASVRALIRHFDLNTGSDVILDEPGLLRGQVANFFKAKAIVHDPEGDRFTEAESTLQTDSVLVDLFGGKAAGKSPYVPGVVAILDPDGSLVIRTELADEEDLVASIPAEVEEADEDDTSKPAEAPASTGGASLNDLGKKKPGAPPASDDRSRLLNNNNRKRPK